MSLKTWKAEFYPVAAAEVPAVDAVAHSLQKWQGLTKANLEKHGIAKNGYKIGAGRSWLAVRTDTCALCYLYETHEKRVDENGCLVSFCAKCPLSLVRDDTACDSGIAGDGASSPYGRWLEKGDPKPMIVALRAAAKYEKQNAPSKSAQP